MADQILSMIQEASKPFKEIHIADRPTIRQDAPSAALGQEPDAQAFSKFLVQPAQAVSPAINVNLPAPMHEARKLGGVLKVDEAKQLSAVLDRFKQSQENRWKEMIERVNRNPSLDVSNGVSKHLEKKMEALERQVGRIHKDLNLPAAEQTSFVQSLGLATEELSKPVKTFFNFVARGERQLYGLQAEIDSIFSKGTETVNPAVMLKLQLKLTHVSQQLELFTSILNKGLESSKTVFNTQI